MPNWLARLLLALMAFVLKANIWPLAVIGSGYRRFVPEPDSVLVTCCTNGLGHVHQLERVLGTLQEAGLKFPVIALAKEQKVPAYKLQALKEKFPDSKFFNLNFEVDYDNGRSFKNAQIAWSATKSGLFKTYPLVRKVTRLLRKHRPAYCLSFWEPGVATYINVMNCPTKLVSVHHSAPAPNCLAQLGRLSPPRRLSASDPLRLTLA